MTKFVKIYESDKIEPTIRELESEGHKIFSVVNGYERTQKENKDVSINHPQRIVDVIKTYYLIVAC